MNQADDGALETPLKDAIRPYASRLVAMLLVILDLVAYMVAALCALLGLYMVVLVSREFFEEDGNIVSAILVLIGYSAGLCSGALIDERRRMPYRALLTAGYPVLLSTALFLVPFYLSAIMFGIGTGQALRRMTISALALRTNQGNSPA